MAHYRHRLVSAAVFGPAYLAVQIDDFEIKLPGAGHRVIGGAGYLKSVGKAAGIFRIEAGDAHALAYALYQPRKI